jgi:hypothetical protein
MRGFFLRMCVILKIFSENMRLFFKISILFEDIFREIEAFLINARGSKIFKYLFSEIKALIK